ncbi:hypothetical protein [Gordonia westfalica]|uniref:Uncharacterized protein n=1 Tax=Gordonia westfalica TaxID=158898 RepID=A0A1H2DQP5_9ACTN|nr:hypothetical protein [Gordonia westfalica]SDT85227.1 hypothetical protein SAMN04488548_1182 [Gordonia westfalica]
MTVAELIAKLQQMPQDATACIDWAQMGVWSEPTGGYYYGEARVSSSMTETCTSPLVRSSRERA